VLLQTVVLLFLGTATSIMVDPIDARGQDTAKTGKEKLQGDWILVSNESRGIIAEIFGQVPEPDKIRAITFSDVQVKLKIADRSIPIGPYNLDSTKVPKTLDLKIGLRAGKRATLQGIYELDGSHLRMCFDSFGDARPSKFPVRAKDSDKPFGLLSVLDFRRIGADPKKDALDRDKAKGASNLAT